MIVNFVGNYQQGIVGEEADQIHITREIEALGHTVQRVPQDIWREYVRGERNPDWDSKLPIKADINIITKWHHFYDGSFVTKLREMTGAPVFYWVWDYMEDNGIPQWHMLMAKCSDLYLTNEYGIKNKYRSYGEVLKNLYYFPFDVCDGELPVYRSLQKPYEVVFFGSCIGQGHRIEWLEKINKEVPVTCFAWNHEEWTKRGFTAYPAVYGDIFNKMVSHSKVILGFSVNPDCWGYWSNRVGKIITAGGFMLYEYAPGMELMVGDAMEYFSSPEEAIEKIKYWVSHDEERIQREIQNRDLRNRFTSKTRIKQLMILADRFIKTQGKGWMF